jgi:hypothetical protein
MAVQCDAACKTEQQDVRQPVCEGEDCVRSAITGLLSTCNFTYVDETVIVRLAAARVFG